MTAISCHFPPVNKTNHLINLALHSYDVSELPPARCNLNLKCRSWNIRPPSEHKFLWTRTHRHRTLQLCFEWYHPTIAVLSTRQFVASYHRRLLRWLWHDRICLWKTEKKNCQVDAKFTYVAAFLPRFLVVTVNRKNRFVVKKMCIFSVIAAPYIGIEIRCLVVNLMRACLGWRKFQEFPAND